MNFAHVLDRWESKIYCQGLLIRKERLTAVKELGKQWLSITYMACYNVVKEFSHNSAKSPDVDNKHVHKLVHALFTICFIF